MKKNVIMTLSCIAAVAIATFVGKKTFVSHAYETSSLLMQNIEALASGSDADGESDAEAEQVTGYAKKWNYSAEYVVTGWKGGAEASISATMKAAILKLFGKPCRPNGQIAASIEKYTLYQKRDIYQEKCLPVPGANCICDPQDNNKWHYKPSTTPSWWGKSDDRCL